MYACKWKCKHFDVAYGFARMQRLYHTASINIEKKWKNGKQEQNKDENPTIATRIFAFRIPPTKVYWEFSIKRQENGYLCSIETLTSIHSSEA